MWSGVRRPECPGLAPHAKPRRYPCRCSRRVALASSNRGNALGAMQGAAEPGMQPEQNPGVKEVARERASEERNRFRIAQSQSGERVRIPIPQPGAEVGNDEELGAANEANGPDPQRALARL